MTIDELREAVTPTLAQIDWSTIDAERQVLLLVEHEGEPVIRVWEREAAIAHFATLPGCAEMLRDHTRPPGSRATVAILACRCFEVSDVCDGTSGPTLH